MMQISKLLIVIVVLIVANGPHPSRAETSADAEGPVRIGVAASMSGSDRAFGERIALGAREAVADLNAGIGGILGRRMEVIVMDDKSDAAEGVAVARRMVQQGVSIVIGHMNSDVALPASRIYAEKGVLMITPSATNVQITDQGLWNVFRTCGRDDQQGEVAGKYIAEKFVGRKIAVIHDDTLYGRGLADATLATMHQLGIAEVLYGRIDLKRPDFAQTVGDLKRLRADVVFWGGLYEGGGKLLRKMREAELTTVMMGGDGINAEEFATLPGAEGTLMTYYPDPAKRAEASETLKKLIAKGLKPGAFTLHSYAAVQVAAAAANQTKSLDSRKIADTMHSGKSWLTILGSISFDSKGDITQPDYVMYTWTKGSDGKLRYVEK